MPRQISPCSGILCTAAGVCLIALAGCGGPRSETMATVEGRITYAGKPLTQGTVVLYPDAAGGNDSQHEPRGPITSDGTYKISTHPRQGAPVGAYRVAVIVTEPSEKGNPYSKPRWLIPEKFGKPEKSGLKLQVRTDAEEGAYDLELK